MDKMGVIIPKDFYINSNTKHVLLNQMVKFLKFMVFNNYEKFLIGIDHYDLQLQ